MNITDRATSGQLLTAIKNTGIKAPEVLEAHTRATRLSSGVRALGAPPAALGLAVIAALDDERDPAADPEVQRLVTLLSISNDGIMQAADSMAGDQFRAVAIEQADALVLAWRKPFNAAVAALVQAHARMGSVDLDDSATILRQGDNVAVVWADAQAAVTMIGKIQTGWIALAGLTRLADTGNRHAVLRLAVVEHDVWIRQELRERRLSVWDALVMGLTLTLPTFGQFRERVAVIEQGETRDQRQFESDKQHALTGRRPVKVS